MWRGTAGLPGRGPARDRPAPQGRRGEQRRPAVSPTGDRRSPTAGPRSVEPRRRRRAARRVRRRGGSEGAAGPKARAAPRPPASASASASAEPHYPEGRRGSGGQAASASAEPHHPEGCRGSGGQAIRRPPPAGAGGASGTPPPLPRRRAPPGTPPSPASSRPATGCRSTRGPRCRPPRPARPGPTREELADPAVRGAGDEGDDRAAGGREPGQDDQGAATSGEGPAETFLRRGQPTRPGDRPVQARPPRQARR